MFCTTLRRASIHCYRGGRELRSCVFSAHAQPRSIPNYSTAYFKAAAVITIAVLGASCLEKSTLDALDIEEIKKDIVEAIEREDSNRDDGTSIGPTLIRLAWHSSGTYSIFDRTGGSSGAGMRFVPESEWGANAGLSAARQFLEPIKNKYGLPYSNTWSLAVSCLDACIYIRMQEQTRLLHRCIGVSVATAVEHMAGPKIEWRVGRHDSEKPSPLPNGRFDLQRIYIIVFMGINTL